MFTIKVGMEEAYRAYDEKNRADGYSLGVLKFTERWGEAMEKAMAEGVNPAILTVGGKEN